MRKQITVARKLPFQRIAQRISVDRDQHQIVSPRKILRRGHADLRGGGEMDEAVAHIDGSAAEHAGMLRLVPKYIFADLVNRRRHGAPIRPRDSVSLNSIPPAKVHVQLTPTTLLISSAAALEIMLFAPTSL
jgi:hypothetical protein